MRHDTWILIANGARARLVAAAREHGRLAVDEIAEFEFDHSPNRDLQRDKPARVFESHGEARHAVEPKSDPHREMKRDFAKEMSAHLSEALAGHRFERLVIVAPPVTLGDLRVALDEKVRAKVVAEVGSDLTKVPNASLGEHIYHHVPL